tara:strand:+ start:2170 stop:2349 length:180 start_codon:yes stop_codon:yes gene_type:complete
MEIFDPAFQNTAVSGVKPLISFAFFTLVGSFFLGALVTSLRRGVKEQGWFKFEKKKEEK